MAKDTKKRRWGKEYQNRESITYYLYKIRYDGEYSYITYLVN